MPEYTKTMKIIARIVTPKNPVSSPMTDSTKSLSETVAEIKPGTQVVEIKHKLVGEGLHTFNFSLTSDADESATQNNQLYSYMLLNKFDKVLIIEGFAGESADSW